MVRISQVAIVVWVIGSAPLWPSSAAVRSVAEPHPIMAPADVPDRTACIGSVDHVMTNLTGNAADAVEQVGARVQGIAGFRAVVFNGRNPVVVVSPETVDSWTSLPPDTSVAVSCVPTALVNAALNVVESTELGPGGFLSAGYDGLRDTVSIITTGPAADILETIDAMTPLGAPVPVGGLRIIQAKIGESGPISRTSDSPPFWGGARIWIGQTGCSTGFYMSSTTFGTVMATAGHCYTGNLQRTNNGDNSRLVGDSEGWSANDPDLALIDGESYYRRSYSSNNQTSNKLISDDVTPQIGIVYCQLGATSLRVCSAYSQLDATASYGGRTVHHLAFTSGPGGPGGSLASPGDSGGGVFKENAAGTLGARGLAVAAGCNATSCWRYDQKVQTIESYYSATVVTAG